MHQRGSIWIRTTDSLQRAVTSEDSSAERVQRGAITKAGNAHLRRLVIMMPGPALRRARSTPASIEEDALCVNRANALDNQGRGKEQSGKAQKILLSTGPAPAWRGPPEIVCPSSQLRSAAQLN